MSPAVGCIPLVLVSLLFALARAQNITSDSSSTAPADCNCGFHDPTTDRFYTDSLIVYFNETKALADNAFTVDTFAHAYEKGWSITYREGASASNVYYENGSAQDIDGGWLNLNVSGYTHEHLVNGAQIQSLRQDILYGTFRALMRSPAPYAGATALAMKLQYNETSSAELDLLNMDNSHDLAWMATTTGNEEPEFSNGVNYTKLGDPPYNMRPWEFMEWRMDWNADSIEWYAGDLKIRELDTIEANLTDVPTAFYLKHWSNGDEDYMQGPPENNTEASIRYLRLFFNSTVNTGGDFSSCQATDFCSTEDETLRLTSPITESMLSKPSLDTKQEEHWTADPAAVGLMAASVAFTGALLLHLLYRKLFVKDDPQPTTHNAVEMNVLRPGTSTSTLLGTDIAEKRRSRPRSHHPRTTSDLPLLGLSQVSDMGSSTTLALTTGGAPTPLLTPMFERKDPIEGIGSIDRLSRAATPSPLTPAPSTPNPDLASTGQKGLAAAATEMKAEGAVAAANPGAKPPPIAPQRNRVDYLAGLVALCSLLVSCTHFILTFVPSVIEEYLPHHYESEVWARKTIEPFFFNEIWVGLFFTTSTRFLTTGFLRNGSLKGLAEKVVCRTPRLMIPITAVILFEYFLMDCGAVKWLEYIPSVTWTTWVNTSVYPNFGWFINATLEIIYLIPNAAPQITWYYATGVLWTIPVQLQNSWLVLLGVVIIREINTPWKRFGYYGFCIINHWYALSWGSYFWFGLMLADLDITYKYRKTITGKSYYHYPLLLLAIVLVFFSLANDLFSIWTGFTFSTEENGIHPDLYTGLPIYKTANAGYPSYTEPKLNGLVFCVCAQYIVELSTWAQKFLSTKPFLLLFPHVFTIYLIHGMVFWSVGSLVCVYFATQELAYWLNMLLTAVICYVVLFASLPIITPVMEVLGKEVTKSIWVGASEEPAVWRPTSWPFSVEQIMLRDVGVREGREEGVK